MMKKVLKNPYFWLILGILMLGGSLVLAIRNNAKKEAEIERLEANHFSLLGQVEEYRTKNGELAASVQALTLKRDEFEILLKAEKRKVENLNIRIRDLKNIGEIGTESEVEIETPIIKPDTIYVDQPVMGTFEWSDYWVGIQGELHPDKIKASITITDTITIVGHRKSRGWWVFRCKGKVTHYDAISANPHTKINHIEYVEIQD